MNSNRGSRSNVGAMCSCAYGVGAVAKLLFVDLYGFVVHLPVKKPQLCFRLWNHLDPLEIAVCPIPFFVTHSAFLGLCSGL